MACAMESAKLDRGMPGAPDGGRQLGFGVSRSWRSLPGSQSSKRPWFMLQLVAAYVGDRGAATLAVETQEATLAAPIDVQAHVVADLDRGLARLTALLRKPPGGAKTNVAALPTIEGQRKARARLVDERKAGSRALFSRPAGPSTPPWPPTAGKSRWKPPSTTV
jgi:hypothetical protein